MSIDEINESVKSAMQQFRFEKQQRNYFQKTAHLTTTFIISGLFSLGFAFDVRAQTRPDRPDFFERGQEQFETEIERLQQQQPESIPILEIDSIDIDSLRWSPVLLREGDATIWMPYGIVSEDTETVESVDGSIEFEIVSSNSAIGRFVVAFSPQVDSFASAEPNELLDRVRTRIIGNQTGFGAMGDRIITFNDYPGREFILKNDEEAIAFRVLLVGDRLYVMAVSQSIDSEHQEAISTFFNSFQPQ